MEKRPQWAYSLITVVYTALFLMLASLIRRSNRAEERTTGGELALLGLATYRLSRLISYDRVTEYLRLPFVETGQGAEHVEGTQEEPKGEGLQLVIGQLLTCTYCSSIWAATFNSAFLLLFPRVGRFFLLSMAGSGLAEIFDPLFPLLSYLSGYVQQEEKLKKKQVEDGSQQVVRPSA